VIITELRAHWSRLFGPLWLWVALGTVGSFGTVLEASTIGSRPRPSTYRWWMHVPAGSYALAHVLFYLSMALLIAAWMAVGVHAFAGRLSVGRSWAVLGCWGLPLWLGTPVFSRDVYSYIAQGTLAHRGFNPYTVAPKMLGAGPLLSSVATVWRATASPYGPLFVAITHLGASISGSSLIGQVLVFRSLEIPGIALMMICLPLLARHYGANPGVALWLGVLSPLALFSAISSAHNDTLMIGLMLGAVTLAMKGARRWALVLFAAAATIKLPAAAGIVFLTAAQMSGTPPREKWRLVVEAVVIPGAVIAAVSEFTGYGWSWLSPSALRIPTELRVLTTPVVSVATLLGSLVHALGDAVATNTVVTMVQDVFAVAAVALIALLVTKVRRTNATYLLGATLLVVVIASPTVWPWYFLWGLTVLGVTSAQRSAWLVATATFAMLLVGPGGTPMIGGNGYYVTGPLVLVGLGWLWWHARWRKVIEGIDRVG
jgi:hypothetical protein